MNDNITITITRNDLRSIIELLECFESCSQRDLDNALSEIMKINNQVREHLKQNEYISAAKLTKVMEAKADATTILSEQIRETVYLRETLTDFIE